MDLAVVQGKLLAVLFAAPRLLRDWAQRAWHTLAHQGTVRQTGEYAIVILECGAVRYSSSSLLTPQLSACEACAGLFPVATHAWRHSAHHGALRTQQTFEGSRQRLRPAPAR